jgi:hypothetical protein
MEEIVLVNPLKSPSLGGLSVPGDTPGNPRQREFSLDSLFQDLVFGISPFPYPSVIPPSIAMTWPVTKEAASEQK